MINEKLERVEKALKIGGDLFENIQNQLHTLFNLLNSLNIKIKLMESRLAKMEREVMR